MELLASGAARSLAANRAAIGDWAAAAEAQDARSGRGSVWIHRFYAHSGRS